MIMIRLQEDLYDILVYSGVVGEYKAHAMIYCVWPCWTSLCLQLFIFVHYSFLFWIKLQKMRLQLLIYFNAIAYSTCYKFYITGLMMTDLGRNIWLY
jgi:hypothetical protein